MPGQWGYYQPGWFWAQVQMTAVTLASGKNELTRKWGTVFEVLSPIARAIAWSEAGDSSLEDSVRETLKHLPELKRRLAEIESYAARHQEIEARK
jgi:hypothetical protein